MEKKAVLTKVLAIAGTIFVWFPIAAPILISAMSFLQEQIWRFDYLMPAELFFSFLLGSGLLLWATLRAHSHVKPVAWGLGLQIAFALVVLNLSILSMDWIFQSRPSRIPRSIGPV